jgi:FkbM family methyltransferase
LPLSARGPVQSSGSIKRLSGVRLSRDARWAAKKAIDLVALERELGRATELPRGERVRLALRRHAAVARDARQVLYLGKTFSYDNRFMPALLPAYLTQIRRLDQVVGLSSSCSLIDVGANVGQFGATVSWRFPTARVWSLEPNLAIFDLLEQNAAQAPNWQAVPWGISEHDEEVSLWAVDGKSGQGSVCRDNAIAGMRGQRATEHKVVTRRLTTERMEALGIPFSVDVVKVDVEGAEASVLLGLAELRWRFLSIETSLGRDGGLTIQGTVDLVEATWGAPPAILWTDTPTRGAATLDVILMMPSGR